MTMIAPMAAQAAITPDAAIQIKVANSNKCLNVDHDLLTNDAAILQYTCGASFPNDKFRVVPKGPGTFQIVANHSGKCLNVYKAAITNSTPVHQYTCSDTATNNLWRFVAVAGKTTFQVVSVQSGKCLNISGNVTTDNAPAIIYTCVNSPTTLNEQFYFPPATASALGSTLPVVRDTPVYGVQGGSATVAKPLVYSYVNNNGQLIRGFQSDPDQFSGIVWTTQSSLELFSGHPAVNVQADGKVQVAARHADDSDLWLTTQTTQGNDTWVSPQDVGGSGIAQPVTGKLPNGKLVAFALVGGKLWHLPQDGTNLPYGLWRYIGGANLVGEPVVALTQTGLRIFALDTAGALQTAVYTNGTLSDWTSLGGSGLTGTPAVLVRPGYVDRVVVRAADGSIVTKLQLSNGTFEPTWTTIAGVSAAGSPGVVLSPKSGKTAIVVRGTDNTVYYTNETGQATGEWVPWMQVNLTPAVTDPTILSYTNAAGAAWGYIVRDANFQTYVVTANSDVMPGTMSASGATAKTAPGSDRLTFTEHRLPKPPKK